MLSPNDSNPPGQRVTVIAEPVAFANDIELLPEAQPANYSDMRRDDMMNMIFCSICVLACTFLITFGFQLVTTLYIQQKWISQVLDRLDMLEQKCA